MEHLYLGSMSFKCDVGTVYDVMSDDVRRQCVGGKTVQHGRTIPENMERLEGDPKP